MSNLIVKLFENENYIEEADLPDYKVIGMDIFGGAFLMDTVKRMFYFAPDTLDIEEMNLNYDDFICWTEQGDVNGFYESFLWEGWEEMARLADESQGISIYPPLWAEEYNAKTASRRVVPLKELLGINIEYRKKFL